MNRGQQGELQAKQYLEQQGLTFVEQNVRFPFGELDLVMRQQKHWVFVEVKYRSNPNFGGAVNAVSAKQVQRIRKATAHYLQLKRIQAPCRFDVVAIDGSHIQWIKGAF
ncbi:YraN family protein [Shewanella sp. 202IG2-18]|uniref:YraN family protein n=1 Tax=Parashewanella hymeniacidonis TaxID=2807618 RepID=UPI00195F91AC|nr:YraN family protein [Parashewanella hymeniacidonis]MBM7072275.1 YraN family protein [Parashewanella hymeniacidonis]